MNRISKESDNSATPLELLPMVELLKLKKNKKEQIEDKELSNITAIMSPTASTSPSTTFLSNKTTNTFNTKNFGTASGSDDLFITEDEPTKTKVNRYGKKVRKASSERSFSLVSPESNHYRTFKKLLMYALPILIVLGIFITLVILLL